MDVNNSSRSEDSSSDLIEKFLSALGPKPYSLEDLEKFTSNFSESNKVGSGGYGKVYKGQFPGGVQVAVKVLTEKVDVIEESFMAEVSTMGKAYHRNLVKLYGYCFERNMKALVYEYMENGSLDKILYENCFGCIEWEKLYNIAIGTAKGLLYLHDGWDEQIIHYDIKASNVLLDKNLCPKITDFGLAKLMNRDESHVPLTRIRGTVGYNAPETWMPGSQVTCKCDVYSFGMMLFEVLGKRRNGRGKNWFPQQVWEKFEKGQLEHVLRDYGITEKDNEKAMILSLVALWCAQYTPEIRPSMIDVVLMLEKRIPVERPPYPFQFRQSSNSSMPPSVQESVPEIYSKDHARVKKKVSNIESENPVLHQHSVVLSPSGEVLASQPTPAIFEIGSLSGTPISTTASDLNDSRARLLNETSVWKTPTSNLRRRIAKRGQEIAYPALRADLLVACQALVADRVAETKITTNDDHYITSYKLGGVQDKGKGGVPVYVMMPSDSVTMGNGVNRKKAMNASMQLLKSAGVEGIMMDVWWGLVERDGPGMYNWGGYNKLLKMAKKVGLKVQAVMSFHQCGGNVGDSCSIPLPKWATEEIDKDPDLAYTDQWKRRNYEYISLGCDTLPVLKGRTPIRCYADFMCAFRDNFQHHLGDTIVEIQVGMGPAGELRYPSYPEQNGTWKFPGIGAFQCYDKYMRRSLKAAAEAAGKPEWGTSGPTDAGEYNNWPEDTQFFGRENGGWDSPYGNFFLSWYSEMLLDHGERILSNAQSIFQSTGVKISVKVAGIHWHYGTKSHAPELTAGYYNTRYRDGYIPIAQMLARYRAIFNFTCIEMRDHELPQDALCAPEKLVRQVAMATHKIGVPLAGENALPRYDKTAYDQILNATSLKFDEIGQESGMCAFTYLRMNPDLFQADNWRMFVSFVKKMKEGKGEDKCWEQIE